MEDIKQIQEFFSKPLEENIVVRMYNTTDKTADLYKEDNPGLEFYLTGKEGQDYVRKYKDHISFPFSSHMNDGTPIPNYEENKEKLAAYLKQKGIPFKTTSAKPYRGVSRTTGEDFMYTTDTFKVPLSHVDIKDISLEENTFKKGDKVIYLGNPAEITFVGKDQMGRVYYSVSYDKGNGKTKASNLYNKGGEIKPLEEGKQLDQVDFAKVVKAVEQTGHPVTVLLVPKFNEIEVLTGMDAPDDMLRDLSNAVDSLGYGRNDIIIAGDSSNLSRREYSDIRRVNGGAKDYFEEAIAEAKVDYDFSERELIRVLRQLKRGASTEIDMIKAFTKALGRDITKDELFSEAITEDDSYARVSKPRFIKDKNNPNFLNVYLDYDIGPGGATVALGKETMSGQIRRLSSAKARKVAHDIALDLEANFNLEDIEVTDLKNGKVRIFAVSDDFIDMDPNMLSEINEGKAYKTVTDKDGNTFKPGRKYKTQYGIATFIKFSPNDKIIHLKSDEKGLIKTSVDNAKNMELVGDVNEQADHVAPMVVKAYKEYLEAKKEGNGEKAYRYYSKKLNNTYSTRADRDAIEAILKKKYGSAMMGEATKDEETTFHKKLDKLVHDTFGKRKGELEEAYVPSNIAEFAKRRGVSSLVRKVAGWAEKVGARITGGTAIGKGYNTLILDMGYQTADIRIDVEDETIELYDEPIYSFNDFKRVFMEEESRKQAEHDEETLRKERGLEEALAEASKGAMNYFNDLKYYYQKAFRYLDVEEREEYKQLAKDFFSRLQIDDKVRAVGLEESSSSEEKRIAKRAIKSIAKYRGVSEDEARNDLIRAAKELGSLKENMSLDDQAKAYYLAKVKRGEIDTLPEDPKAAFLAQMMKDQISHDKETLRRERGLEETAAYIAETIKLGMMVNEELCEKGKRYIKARQAAGEKSSAYLSGRAVRVCKGQIEWPKKSKNKK